MANVNIELGYKPLVWFTANPTIVLLAGQIVYLEQTGTYKIGDGVSTLSALSFLGVSSEIQTLQNVTDLGSTTTNAIDTAGITTDYVQLDLTAVNTNAVGKLIWNNTDGTLDLGLKGGNVTLQVGQEITLCGRSGCVTISSTSGYFINDMSISGNSIFFRKGFVSDTHDFYTKLGVRHLSGGFPEVESLEDLTTVCNALETKWREEKETTQKEIPMKQITYQQAEEIISIACSTWKTKLAEKWAKKIVLKQTIEVSAEFEAEMLKAATPEQRAILNKIFIVHNIKEGDLCWVTDTSAVWNLRYAKELLNNGELDCYDYQRTSGSTTSWSIFKKAEGITLPN